jgi:hypothetical protein
MQIFPSGANAKNTTCSMNMRTAIVEHVLGSVVHGSLLGKLQAFPFPVLVIAMGSMNPKILLGKCESQTG